MSNSLWLGTIEYIFFSSWVVRNKNNLKFSPRTPFIHLKKKHGLFLIDKNFQLLTSKTHLMPLMLAGNKVLEEQGTACLRFILELRRERREGTSFVILGSVCVSPAQAPRLACPGPSHHSQSLPSHIYFD